MWPNTVVLLVVRLPGRSLQHLLELNNQNFWESEKILISFLKVSSPTLLRFFCVCVGLGDATVTYSSALDHWLFLYYWVISVNKKWYVSQIILFYKLWNFEFLPGHELEKEKYEYKCINLWHWRMCFP